MAEKVKELGTSRLTVGAHYQFHHRIAEIIREITPEALHIEEEAARYFALEADYSLIINRDLGYLSTEGRKTKDKKRDNVVGVINRVVIAHRTNPIETRSEPAQNLYVKLGNYRGIAAHEYEKETSEIAGMVRMLKSELCAPWVAALGLTEEVELLGQINQEMEASTVSKGEEKEERAQQTDLDTQAIRKELDRIFLLIAEKQNAYALILPSEATSTFIRKANGIIGVYEDILDSSSSAGGSGEGGSSEDGSDNGSDGTDGSDETEPTPDGGGTTPDEGGSDNGGETPPPTPGGGDDDEEVVG